MKFYIVMMKNAHNVQWFDSFWISPKSAGDRMENLIEYLRANGIASWTVWVQNARIEDGKLGSAA